MSGESESSAGPDSEPLGDLRHRCGRCQQLLTGQKFMIVEGGDYCLTCAATVIRSALQLVLGEKPGRKTATDFFP